MPRLQALVTVLVLLLAATFVFDHDAWTPDEPRVLGLGRSAAEGHWVAPRLSGRPFLEQPPLGDDLLGVAFRLFGFHVAVARAVSVVCGLATLGVTCIFARELGGRRLGTLAALLLALTAGFLWNTHRIVVDPLLALCVAGSGLASLRGLGPPGARPRGGWLLFAYGLASLAYLVKGPVGIGLSGFAFVAVVVARREPRLLQESRLWAAPLVFALVTAPYHVLLYRELGTAGLRELLVDNGLARALGDDARQSHVRPLWFYGVDAVPELLPTLPLAIGSLVFFWRQRDRLTARQRFALEVPALWFALGFVALSLAASKREAYLLPLEPALATLAALGLEPLTRTARAAKRLALVASGAVLVLALSAAFVVPSVDSRKSLGPPLERAGSLVPPGLAIHVLHPDETALGAVPFYTGRDAVALDDRAALVRQLETAGELYVLVIEKHPQGELAASVRDLGPTVLLEDVRPDARTVRLLHFAARRRH